MVNLTYTEEMKEQDRLWETEQEDVKVMSRLYNQIIAEAKEKGFKGRCEYVEWGREMTCSIYENEDDDEAYAIVGFCKPLISRLKEIMDDE